MMNWLLAFLLAYLLPGVDDLDVEPPEDDEPPADEPPADDEPPEDEPPADEDDPEPDDEPPAPRETRAQKTIRETRERAQKAERDLAEARAQLDAARRPQQPQGPATPDPEQVLWQQEEETLRNPEANDWQKYAINANRAARQAQAQIRQVQQQTMDMNDRTAFQAYAASNPKAYAVYKDKVEAKLQELRARGQNPSREVILKIMLGEDMLAGNVRSATKKPTTPAAPRRAAPASDVPARPGRPSDAEARAKRLENIRI
jgi:hypothetical protein